MLAPTGGGGFPPGGPPPGDGGGDDDDLEVEFPHADLPHDVIVRARAARAAQNGNTRQALVTSCSQVTVILPGKRWALRIAGGNDPEEVAVHRAILQGHFSFNEPNRYSDNAMQNRRNDSTFSLLLQPPVSLRQTAVTGRTRFAVIPQVGGHATQFGVVAVFDPLPIDPMWWSLFAVTEIPEKLRFHFLWAQYDAEDTPMRHLTSSSSTAFSTPPSSASSTPRSTALSTPPSSAASTPRSTASSTPPSTASSTPPSAAFSTAPYSASSTAPSSASSTACSFAFSTPPSSTSSTPCSCSSASSSPCSCASSTPRSSASSVPLSSASSTSRYSASASVFGIVGPVGQALPHNTPYPPWTSPLSARQLAMRHEMLDPLGIPYGTNIMGY